MHELAPDVWQVPLARGEGVNAYLVGDILVDAGTKAQARRLLRAVEGRPVRALAVTHAHPGHAGGAGLVQDELGIPLWVGRGDVRALEDGEPELADGPLMRLLGGFLGSFDGRPADRELVEGDELGAGFVALETPGHSPGHLCFWREADGVLLCGDVLAGRSRLRRRPGLHGPPASFTPDPAGNDRAVRRVAGLAPGFIGFGHGPALRDATAALHEHLNK